MQETTKHPSKRYVSRASAIRDSGFRGQFAIPGLIPDYVRRNGSAEVFKTADEAELAASRVVMQLANDRLALRTRFKSAEAMSTAALSKILDDIDITPTELVELLQTEHVMSWLGGERRVPHMAHIILELMLDDDIKAKVKAITAEAIRKGKTI